MIPFRFPFRWGAPVPTSVATAAAVPLWSEDSPFAPNWVASVANFMPRFQGIGSDVPGGNGFVEDTDVVS